MAFSLKQLFLVFLVSAAGMTALVSADRPLVAEVTDLLTILILILVGYSIWVTEGEERALRCGFLGWAGAYFVATKWWSVTLILGTYRLIAQASELFLPTRISSLKVTGGFNDAYTDWLNRFESIAQCLITLALGVIGGCVTVLFYRKRQSMLHTSAAGKPRSGEIT